MAARRLACAFVDGVDNAGTQSLHFIGGAHDRILLEAPGAVAELCIWASVEVCPDAASAGAPPLRKLALSLWAHGMEIDWITYEDAAVAPPAGRTDAAYTVDHIFPIPAWLTFHACVFEVRATGDGAPIGTARLALELPLPF
ncbi:hypothetical protein [Pseudoduganella umbonata]|uniref:Uncharacterized protein n=1 Tax=Pseudoduganella umbonata TaxID=864828 RepID=A0A4P8HYD1_9BURK|nr:hypothetical protein [Pseudoduganella umbonata]MBB3223426.1 hypothetical protein [Pseudoduganella umbonata]QCP13680.1 hypothetical protein FCL38_27040 [Pseudoduganella umbonata]